MTGRNCSDCGRTYCSKQYKGGCEGKFFQTASQILTEEEKANRLKRFVIHTDPVNRVKEEW